MADFRPREGGEPRAKLGNQPLVNLKGEEPPGLGSQEESQRALTWPDLNAEVFAPEARSLYDRSGEVRVSQEVLPERPAPAGSGHVRLAW